jgi:hypothetical protein
MSPRIIRRLPAWSVTGSARDVEAVHLTVADVVAPVLLTSASGVLREVPVALFQLAAATTPALSAAPIATPIPTKSMLMSDAFDDVTEAEAVALWVRVPLEPATANVVEPGGVDGEVVSVSVDVPVVVTKAGENDADAPSGSPEAERSTWPVKPFTGAMVTV